MSSNSTNKKEIRKFGTVAAIFFGILTTVGIFTGKAIPVSIFGFLSILGVSFILAPGHTYPIYKGWLKVAHIIGKIINVVILTLIYYLVITPAAQIKRLFGGSPIPLKPDKTSESYWVPRNEPAQPRERFLKRF